MLLTANAILLALGIHFIDTFALKQNDSLASEDADDYFLNAPESVEKEITHPSSQSRVPRWIHSGLNQKRTFSFIP